jgi:hypothetical protein
MNPLTWKWQHLVTWAILILLGGVAGMVFGWFVSPFSHAQGDDAKMMFFAWLHYPLAYWPYILGGAATTGMAYYSADLLTGAR